MYHDSEDFVAEYLFKEEWTGFFWLYDRFSNESQFWTSCMYVLQLDAETFGFRCSQWQIID